jgi:hypothetical protein
MMMTIPTKKLTDYLHFLKVQTQGEKNAHHLEHLLIKRGSLKCSKRVDPIIS